MPITENLFQLSLGKQCHVGDKLYHKNILFKIIIHHKSKNYDTLDEIIHNIEYHMNLSVFYIFSPNVIMFTFFISENPY